MNSYKYIIVYEKNGSSILFPGYLAASLVVIPN